MPLYPSRGVPAWLASSVLVAGIAPAVLALVGLAATLRRRSLASLHLFVATAMAVYTWWVLQGPDWMLKTKYILFLYPAYVLYALFGLAFLERRIGRRFSERVVPVTALVAVALTLAYLVRFAVGTP
jgi:hypothetical protein